MSKTVEEDTCKESTRRRGGTVDVGGGVFETTGSVVEEIVLKTCKDLEGNWILGFNVLAASIVGNNFRGSEVHYCSTGFGTCST